MPHTPTGAAPDDDLSLPTDGAVSAYLERIGVDPATVTAPDLDTLERLQRAHVTTIPFETLAITGDPYGKREGEGVVLSVPHLYEKIVERGRGGYCYELNGLFAALLAELGCDVRRAAARMVRDVRIPANHHVIIVGEKPPHLVDVGMGPPKVRRPLPLTGEGRTDESGVEWRVTESDRPDARYRSVYRRSGDDEWTPRCIFGDIPRPLHYFAATNDYFQTAPESPFTGEPHISIATNEGHRTLSGDTFTERTPTGERERTVTGDDWHALLESAFGLCYDRGGADRA
jgi:N-hydroxyarylamine O-acetyltransferase